MILHCDTPVHPLIHHGTQQRDRLLKSIIPGQLILDDRSMEDLLAYAGKLAKHVRYWNSENEDAGDWVPFWESDTTPLLAMIAATDLDTCQTTFRSKELEYHRLKKREDQGLSKEEYNPSAQIIEEMVTDPSFGIYGMAGKIQEICQKAPDGHPIKTEIIKIIETTLQQPLIRLIQFHKAVEQNAILKYRGFIGAAECASPWKLPDNNAFECIDYISPYEHREELWKLFLKFFQALSLIIDKAKKAFKASLRSRNDHHPHITLFLAFLHLFRYVQSDLNSLTEKHLLFYYQDVLRLQQRRLIPDKVHLVFQIAQNMERYRIQQGTLLPGGTDAGGLPLLYSLEDELLANQVKLIEKRSTHFFKLLIDNKSYALPISAVSADKADGYQKDFKPGEKVWNAFSRADIFMDAFYSYSYRLNQTTSDNVENKPKNFISGQNTNLLLSSHGLIISSPELWLAKSDKRIITLKYSVFENGFISKFDFKISTTEGLLTLSDDSSEEKNYKIKENDSIEITFDKSFPAIAPITEENSIYNGLPDQPFLIITPSSNALGDYEKLKKITINDITLHTSSENIKSFDVQVGDTLFPSIAQIPLLGAASSTPVNIYVRTEELNRKRFSSIEKISSETDEVTVGTVTIHIKDEPKRVEITNFYAREDMEGKVTGRVVAANDDPLSGATVLVKGTNIGTVTDIEGSYSIPVPPNAILVFSSIDYKTQEIAVGEQTSIDVRLVEDTLEEINGGNEFIFNKVEILYAGDWISDINKKEPSYSSIPQKFTSDVKDGFIRISGTIDPPAKRAGINNYFSGINNYFLGSESIAVSYQSRRVSIPINNEDAYHRLFYLHPFGVAPIERGNAKIPLIPRYHQPVLDIPREYAGNEVVDHIKDIPEASGNLFLGFEKLKPNQTLSLLFKMAEGTGNPDHFAPEVVWSYLRNDEWWQIPPQFILKDETLGMKQTGILLFQIPEDINNGNTWITGEDNRTDLYWLRASVTEIPEDYLLVDALPMLVDIHVNAATAVFKNNNNTSDHLVQGLPAGTIAALRFRDVNVKTVEQPYASFGGRLSEDGNREAFYRRIHERLRHRQRAVTVWDYERLILEKFPKVAVAKCLSHTRRFAAAMPGYVTMAVIPYPDKMVGYRKFYPNLDAGDLEAMRKYILRLNSYFVGGYGEADFCCCDGDCHCNQKPGRLTVINARFEPVRLKICIRFREGKDIPFYTKKLNEALKNFLAPWAQGSGRPLLFGASIHTTHLLEFLKNLDYVDVVLSLQVKQFANRESADYGEGEIPWSDAEFITPFTAASLLTSYLDRMNKDNPNVIDHVINVVAKHDHCSCAKCSENDNGQAAMEMNNLAFSTEKIWREERKGESAINKIKTSMDKMVNDRNIKEYNINKIKTKNIITELEVQVTKLDGSRESFTIRKPDPKKK